MTLSTPVFILKRQARALSRRRAIPLHLALDAIAKREGFKSWSQLAAAIAAERPAAKLFSSLRRGRLALIGGRPGQGKTLLGLELAALAVRRGNDAAFFTLDFTRADVARCLGRIGPQAAAVMDRLLIDTSDDICASYIVDRLASARDGTLAIVDYLQLLDQRRCNPPIADQLAELKAFARKRRSTIVCLSQIDRRFDPNERGCPGLSDVRLPNPVDLDLFDRACFVHGGRMELLARPG